MNRRYILFKKAVQVNAVSTINVVARIQKNEE